MAETTTDARGRSRENLWSSNLVKIIDNVHIHNHKRAGDDFIFSKLLRGLQNIVHYCVILPTGIAAKLLKLVIVANG